MGDLDGVQPHCPHCGTVMIDDRRGFWCENCQHLEDHSAEFDAVVLPTEFDGPSIQGG